MPRKSCANQNRGSTLMLPKSNMPPTSSGQKNMIRNMYGNDDSSLTGIFFFSYYISSTNEIFRYSFQVEPPTPMTDGTTTAPSPRDHHIDYASITLPDQIDVSRAVRHHLNLSQFSGWQQPRDNERRKGAWNSDASQALGIFYIFNFSFCATEWLYTIRICACTGATTMST